eukprot:g1380.t1
MSISLEEYTGDLKKLLEAVSDPERAKARAGRSEEENKQRYAGMMMMAAKKYGFEDVESFTGALKKYEDDDEVKELRSSIEQARKNVSSGK